MRISLAAALFTFVCGISLPVQAEGPGAGSQAKYEARGFYLGMDYDTMLAAIEADNLRTQLWTGSLRGLDGEYPLRIDAADTSGTERMGALFSAPPDTEKLIRFTREVTFNDRSQRPLFSQLEQSLSQKYGNPTFKQRGKGWVNLVWSNTPSGGMNTAKVAEQCKLKNIYQAWEYLETSYNIGRGDQCGETMWVYVSLDYNNSELISRYQVALYNPGDTQKRAAATNALVNAKAASAKAQETEKSKSNPTNF